MKGRLNRTWMEQVEEESMKVGLRREDVLWRSKWIVGVYQISSRLRGIWPHSVVDTARF